MKTTYKKYVFWSVFLLVVSSVLLFSCEKNNEQFFEHESTDKSENNEDKLFSDDLGKTEDENFPIEIKPRTPKLPYDYTFFDDDDLVSDTLLYKYTPYYIYEGWNYIEIYTPEIKNSTQQM
ncbi:hypothetical protein [Treponema sp. R80B11-R83G3]